MTEQSNLSSSQEQDTKSDGLIWVWLVLIAFCALVVCVGLSGVIFNGGDSPHMPTINDIRQLSIALESFKLKFGVYPPSRILLANDEKDYDGDRSSLAYLSAIWPRLKWDEKIDWSGGVPGFKSAKLEGDQCLVYFLYGPIGEGFSTNPANPTQSKGARMGPFFEFSENRLIKRMKDNPFSSYQDGFGKNVYVFFSTGKNVNQYGNDCPSLKVAPYFVKGSDPVRYYNRNTFQIISAGKDGIFGPGGPWAAESAAEDAGKNGADDLSNFYGEMLGK